MTAECDVTAMILTYGETYRLRAARSLLSQLSPIMRDIVVVDFVRPFHHAFNVGFARATTPFVLQVDADMILDRDALGHLRSLMDDHVGAAIGHLRDPLVGRIEGVKLFRRAAVPGPMPDSISPDTDLLKRATSSGYGIVYAVRYDRFGSGVDHTVGEHRPHYTSAYTFRKYLLEGQRYCYRRRPDGLRWHLRCLAQRRLPVWLEAMVALLAGTARNKDSDGLDAGLQVPVPDVIARNAQSNMLRWSLVGEAMRIDRPPMMALHQLGKCLARYGCRKDLECILETLDFSDSAAVAAGCAFCAGISDIDLSSSRSRLAELRTLLLPNDCSGKRLASWRQQIHQCCFSIANGFRDTQCKQRR